MLDEDTGENVTVVTGRHGCETDIRYHSCTPCCTALCCVQPLGRRGRNDPLLGAHGQLLQHGAQHPAGPQRQQRHHHRRRDLLLQRRSL